MELIKTPMDPTPSLTKDMNRGLDLDSDSPHQFEQSPYFYTFLNPSQFFWVKFGALCEEKNIQGAGGCQGESVKVLFFVP